MKNFKLKYCRYKSWQGIKVKIYRQYNSEKFQAIAFIFGKRIFWIFTKEAYQNWPATNG